MSWKLVGLIVVFSIFVINSSLCDECHVKVKYHIIALLIDFKANI